jgi:hypothetical protein
MEKGENVPFSTPHAKVIFNLQNRHWADLICGSSVPNSEFGFHTGTKSLRRDGGC